VLAKTAHDRGLAGPLGSRRMSCQSCG